MMSGYSLTQAALDGNVDFLSAALDEKLDVNSVVNECDQLCFIAYIHGHVKFVHKLLEAGLHLDPEVIPRFPVQEKRHINCLAELLWFQVYNDALKLKGHNECSKSLFHASFRKDFSKCSDLFHKILSAKSRKSKSKSESHELNGQMFSILLFLLLYYLDSPDFLIQMLIDNGADMNASFHGFQIGAYAALCGNSNGLELLLNNDCIIDGAAKDSSSPFHCAIRLSSLDCLDALLSQNGLANLNIWKNTGIELLVFAVTLRHDRCVDVLIKYGARIDRYDKEWPNNSPLIIASKTGNTLILEKLLHHGADVNWANEIGETALMHAALMGHSACLELLIAHGADVNAADCDQESALMHATRRGHVNCVRSLIKTTAHTSVVDAVKHETVFHAVALESTECLELILSSEGFQSHFLIPGDRTRDAFAFALRQFDVKKLLILLKHGVFTWNWLDNFPKLPTEILARVMVAANVSPGHFQCNNKTTTLFQHALDFQDVWTAFYIMANLYLNELDIEYMLRDTHFLPCLRGKGNVEVSSATDALISQPFQLQTLSILTVSSTLSYKNHTKRQDVINSLPIPDKFKKVLNFQGPYSNLCVDKWKMLGTELGKINLDDLSVFKPLCLEFDPCEETRCSDNATGYRLRYSLLSQRNRWQ